MKVFSRSVSHFAVSGTVVGGRLWLACVVVDCVRRTRLTIWEYKVDCYAEQDCKDPLAEEKPLPAGEVARAGREVECVCEEATENSSQVAQDICC